MVNSPRIFLNVLFSQIIHICPWYNLMCNSKRKLIDRSPLLARCRVIISEWNHTNARRLSKIIECVVVVILDQRLIQNGLREVLRSAYKHKHSTETAVRKVKKWSAYGSWHTWGSSSHPAWFICCIWYFRPFYTVAPTAWVGYQKRCIGGFQVISEHLNRTIPNPCITS